MAVFPASRIQEIPTYVSILRIVSIIVTIGLGGCDAMPLDGISPGGGDTMPVDGINPARAVPESAHARTKAIAKRFMLFSFEV
jgi:hypothetical protein